ncbi:MAG: UDP-N-acetylmuramate dehydrogenase [Clostridia bacterium]|nr:UDP-N-acetylmuramate dehydrogenase [Clostridia bacterium]
MGILILEVIRLLDKERLSSIAEDVLYDEPMSAHTTFRIGGNADAFVNASSALEIGKVIHFCEDTNTPYMIVGNGSNLLVSDKGIRGVVIHIGKAMSKCRIDGDEVTADAGILMSQLAHKILEANLTGFEFAAGIPGTLGGGLFMNAGAYGGELKDIVETVTFIAPDGLIKTETADNLKFGYRTSIFAEGGYTILSAKMLLKEGVYDEIKATMADLNSRRSEKQPLSQPSAGSTFKRPDGYFAGKLIQDAGLMGYKIGGAMVSDKHAGFVVNTGGATAKDVMDLIRYVQKTVNEKFGVMLEPEVRMVGEA